MPFGRIVCSIHYQHQSVFWRSSLTDEGFIHASPKHQLARVAQKHYRQVENLMLLEVECDLVTPEVKWESAAGDLYPHIYGEININAVVSAQAIEVNSQGEFDFSALTFAE